MTRPDDLLLGAGAPDVLVRARVARIIAGPLADLINREMDKGARVDPELIVTSQALSTAAECYRRHRAEIAASGKAEMGDAEMPSLSPYEDEIGIGEAAGILGCSERNARYLAPSIPGARKVGRGWVFDRVDLVEFAEQRRSA